MSSVPDVRAACVQTRKRDRSEATHTHLAPRAVCSCFSVPHMLLNVPLNTHPLFSHGNTIYGYYAALQIASTEAKSCCREICDSRGHNSTQQQPERVHTKDTRNMFVNVSFVIQLQLRGSDQKKKHDKTKQNKTSNPEQDRTTQNQRVNE